AGDARRAVGTHAHRGRRMGTPEREAFWNCRATDGAYSKHPDGRRHHRRLCRRLRRLRALWLPRAWRGLHPARFGGAGDACGGPTAWAGTRGPWARWRLRDAAPRRFGEVRLLV